MQEEAAKEEERASKRNERERERERERQKSHKPWLLKRARTRKGLS